MEIKKSRAILLETGAGDGNRTHVRSLGSLQFKLNKRWIGVICDDLNGSKWQTRENGNGNRLSQRTPLSELIQTGLTWQRVY
jgi:hypothetical protein